ncbi:phage baseplate assembly protein V [Nocardioides lianchengensis]|uniref:Uncharacterized conserved protein, implicated in type VI secretion and phage assembly n=1 Tax=Nocardioides lianchengensis TaxID=1045774 RepID=A0A1G6XML1_9ACTN|nr:phage baseplate assembly protein V [Nocardioides lianchengensis]NYG13368.1 uncharacterized protein involved in type VI secretion and phage assembly [Nocardioides lianchengensis]SDD79454.1 Uncharacterized conserved protein, implicated in type VI secretion and phage assembly [Nocardioides lianchengensis]
MPAVLTAPSIKLEGASLAQKWLENLMSVRVERALGLVGRSTLRFVDNGYALATSAAFKVGAEVEILAGTKSLFKGEVTGIALDQDGLHTPELIVTVDDKAHRMGGSVKSRAFLNQTYSDIISKLVAGTGLSASVSGATGSHPYLLQAGSDLDYLNALVSRGGLVWFVDGTSLKVQAAGTSSATVTLELGTTELWSFSVKASAAGPDKVSVTGWDQSQQAAIKGESEVKSSAESDFVTHVPGRSGAGSRGWSKDALVADPPPLNSAEATTLAKSFLADVRAAGVLARGAGQANGAIAPGVTVTVANAGPTSGSYLVSKVEHTYNHSQGFLTKFTAGPHRPADMVDVLGAGRRDPGLTMSGVLPALVTDLADPDKIGRAKVKYTTISGDVESHWARLVTLGGGDKRGMVFTPEVNDEVLIAFEQGDTRRPVILGGLFSKNKGLPTADDVDQNKVKYRRITSRLGHLIELADGDQPAEQHILITLKGKKHKIRLGEDKFDIEIDKKPVTITNGQATIKFSDSGDVTIEGNNITLKAKQKVDISGGTEVGIKGTTKAALGGAQVEVKADGMGKVEAGGPLTIKGAMVAIN